MNVIPDQTPIDPNQFALDWALLFELLALIIVLAFMIERALALFFESKLFVQYSLVRKKANRGDFKPIMHLLFPPYLQRYAKSIWLPCS